MVNPKLAFCPLTVPFHTDLSTLFLPHSSLWVSSWQQKFGNKKNKSTWTHDITNLSKGITFFLGYAIHTLIWLLNNGAADRLWMASNTIQMRATLRIGRIQLLFILFFFTRCSLPASGLTALCSMHKMDENKGKFFFWIISQTPTVSSHFSQFIGTVKVLWDMKSWEICNRNYGKIASMVWGCLMP